MNYLYPLIAGIVQGLTEFLPISSSGHLVLLHELFDFQTIDNLTFDVVMHLGTLVALLGFFAGDVWRYFKAFVKSVFKLKVTSADGRISWLLCIGTIPAIVAGYFFENQLETFFRQGQLVAIMLIVFGVLLWFVDRYSQKLYSIEQVTVVNAILIGVAQAIALIPGVSRSGITIIAGLSQKLNREAAARFSFLLSMPIVFGAGLKKMLDLNMASIPGDQWLGLAIGFAAAAVVGYLTIKYFLAFLKNHSLRVFAYYRIVIGIVLLLILMI